MPIAQIAAFSFMLEFWHALLLAMRLFVAQEVVHIALRNAGGFFQLQFEAEKYNLHIKPLRCGCEGEHFVKRSVYIYVSVSASIV